MDLALPRTAPESHVQADSVTLAFRALRPCMGGRERIGRRC